MIVLVRSARGNVFTREIVGAEGYNASDIDVGWVGVVNGLLADSGIIIPVVIAAGLLVGTRESCRFGNLFANCTNCGAK